MSSIKYLLNDAWDEYGDERVKSFYLMSGGPSKVLSIIAIYLLLIKYIGPKFMKDREPYKIRPIILIYNSLMIGFNGIGFLLSIWITNFFTKCWYVLINYKFIFFFALCKKLVYYY